ncbi:hypothetical protein T484DRAFT_1879399 [Baffinella frigidus]|nr:hypothetical protein T484DRAFT_1879399 [Cryptophyta sp. CCMP2293]
MPGWARASRLLHLDERVPLATNAGSGTGCEGPGLGACAAGHLPLAPRGTASRFFRRVRCGHGLRRPPGSPEPAVRHQQPAVRLHLLRLRRVRRPVLGPRHGQRLAPVFRQRQQLRRWPLAHLLRLPPGVSA